ncbi:hypothetical protein [Paracoccus benzoatiresistens]|uniref:Uncharacterized protein n=1 Tax=Paracoccus benzoatiresistens TaxID=2997341 RepID=A0ABT4J8G3_9RHOB|nr:hypothetical protein [Paracoccus sp. EF6]MCZ0963400.1 hypothetical protein [Paracoccus sp. EF6]
MENEYIELLTVDESEQVKTIAGGLGYDTISSCIRATTLSSGNSQMITGDEERDYLHTRIEASAWTPVTAMAIGNFGSAGGAENDSVDASLWAVAYGGKASVVGAAANSPA